MDYVTPSTTRSAIMRSVSNKNTDLELLLRRELWRAGLRYRLHRRIAGSRPDVCFPSRRVAVFVDGCFWHGCPVHYRPPKQNAGFWEDKLRKNRDRDRRDTANLENAGWVVVRVWGCEVRHAISSAVEQVLAALREGSQSSPPRRPFRRRSGS